MINTSILKKFLLQVNLKRQLFEPLKIKYFRNIDAQSLKTKINIKKNQRHKQLKEEQFQHYNNNENIKQLLAQSNLKKKEIKNIYEKIQNQIKNKYTKQLEQSQFLQDEIKQSYQQKMQQEIQKNRKMMQEKLKNLTYQFKTTFKQQNKLYEENYVKQYMLKTVSQSQNQVKDTTSKDQYYMPNKIILKKLAHQKFAKQILLIGLQKNNQEHCIFTNALLQKLKIKNVLTVIPPDMPFFIKTQTSYLVQWKKFLQTPGPNFKFYLNPTPHTLKDICIQKDYFAYVRQSMSRSKNFYQTIYSVMQYNEVTSKYEHQPLFSGLMSKSVQNVYFCDYPVLKERQMMALTVKLQDLRQLIKKQVYFRQKKNVNYSGQLLLPMHAIQKKFQYIISIAKTISKSCNEPCAILCKADMAESLSHEWEKSKKQNTTYNYSENQYYLNANFNNANLTNEPPLFIDFIQKLVILDIIISPIIQDYFVINKSFPFSCYNTVGGKQNLSKVFIIWNHFRNIYTNLVKNQEAYNPQKSGDLPM